MTLEEYLGTAKRDDTKTICIFAETEISWSAGELLRNQLAPFRREYQRILDYIKAVPDSELILEFEGDTYDGIRQDFPMSLMYETVNRGNWTQDEADQIGAVALNCGESKMAELHLTHEMISAIHLKMYIDPDGRLTTEMGFVLRRSAIPPDSEDYEIRDGAHRMFAMRRITRH